MEETWETRPYHAYCVKIGTQFSLLLAACKHVFPLCYSDTRSTFANYLLLRYISTGSCCYGMKVCKHDYVYQMIYLLHTSRSTEYVSFLYLLVIMLSVLNHLKYNASPITPEHIEKAHLTKIIIIVYITRLQKHSKCLNKNPQWFSDP